MRMREGVGCAGSGGGKMMLDGLIKESSLEWS